MTWIRLHANRVCGSCSAPLAKGTVVRSVASGIRCQPCAYRIFPFEVEPPGWLVDGETEIVEKPWLKWMAPIGDNWYDVA